MNHCECENWSLQDLSDALQNMHKGNKRIVVPMFQRGKRWNKAQEDKFIDSLKKGYPVGTLLFYGYIDNGVQTYILVDGLQRGTCIKKFITKPTLFMDVSNISDDLCHQILDVIDRDTMQNVTIIKEILTSFVKENDTYNDRSQTKGVVKKILKEFEIKLGEDVFDFIDPISDYIDAFLKEKQDLYNAIAKTIIPVIVYSGDEDNLPEIFDRINSQGTPLDQYEVYAASWPINNKRHIENTEIIESVIKKYDTLKEDGYVLHDYSSEDIRYGRMLNAFEYLFGLSKFLVNEYSILGFNAGKKDDEVNPLAFELVNACLNDSNKIKVLYKDLEPLDINAFEKAVIKCIEYVGEVIKPVITFKGNARKKTKIFHAKYQILSMISCTFKQMYDHGNYLAVSDQWKERKAILDVTLPQHYVYDIISNYWSEGGTGKIYTVAKNNKYMSEIGSRTFDTALDSFFEKSLNRAERQSVQNPRSEDFVILNCIYLTTFKAIEHLSLEKFDVEHIAPKEQMKKLIEACNGDGLPISCVANLCYLPEFVNRSKGSKNFYQDSKYLEKQPLDDIERRFSFTQKEDLDWMDVRYKEGDFKKLKKAYIDFCSKRFRKLKKHIFTALGIKNIEEGSTNDGTEINEPETVYFPTPVVLNPAPQGRDNTRYSLNGGPFVYKSDFVLELVNAYIRKYPNATYIQIKAVFNDSFCAKSYKFIGFLCTKNEFNDWDNQYKEKRYKPARPNGSLKSSDGIIFYVSTQWTKEAMGPIVEIAEREGFVVKVKE